LRSRSTKLDKNKKEEVKEQLRSALTPKVYEATVEAIKKEVGKSDFDPKSSPLLKEHSGEGGEGLLILLKELFGFGKEAANHISKE
jgi:hypothetical protein